MFLALLLSQSGHTCCGWSRSGIIRVLTSSLEEVPVCALEPGCWHQVAVCWCRCQMRACVSLGAWVQVLLQGAAARCVRFWACWLVPLQCAAARCIWRCCALEPRCWYHCSVPLLWCCPPNEIFAIWGLCWHSV